MRELTRDLEQVRIHNAEVIKVKAYERKSFYENLDRLEREREEEHNAGLTAAAARHEEVRREAEDTLKEYFRQLEEERLRKEEEERRERERLEKERAEKERREREEAERREAEKRAKEEAARKKAEEEERARKAAEDEKQRKENERVEQENKRQEEERQRLAKEETERRAAEEKKQRLEKLRELGGGRRTAQEVAEQRRYVELHQHLKKFRKYMMDQTKNNPTLKQHMGDMRRKIKKCVGQLTEVKGSNKQPVSLPRCSLLAHKTR
jgi:nucleoporin GLE1